MYVKVINTGLHWDFVILFEHLNVIKSKKTNKNKLIMVSCKYSKVNSVYFYAYLYNISDLMFLLARSIALF